MKIEGRLSTDPRAREWRAAIEEAKIALPPYSDVLTGKAAPKNFGEPVARDVNLDGIICDIYHSYKGPEHSLHRIFIHQKA